MTTTIERPILADESPAVSHVLGVQLIHVAEGRWRVVDATGRAIGHIASDTASAGTRYRAQRYHAATRMFRDVGTFWSADDAVSALRYSR